ncbi:hypothetical protein [Cognatilysobacter lacus]|uniref:hypothetical protein n=1 Tax=Cognatilysobacter lacus TaxID=1643323 RepID=UPI0016595048|nr:hypothetical protein [Lysobacter lacus]
MRRSASFGLLALVACMPATGMAQAWAQNWPIKPPAPVATPAPSPSPAVHAVAVRIPFKADFRDAAPPPEVKLVADWALDSTDNRGLPYLIVDKVDATVFVFDARGRLQGTGPALLGITPGDRAPAGVGAEKLAAMPVQDRITPAGRFVASLDRDLHGQSILWIDYASALALHRIVKGTVDERRAERMQTASSQDNRISYGCINVPADFFDTVVIPAFKGTSGVVYILPEMGTARETFGAYDVDSGPGSHVAAKVP